MIRAALVALGLCLANAAAAEKPPVECRDIEYRDNGYTLCMVDVAAADLRLFLYGADDILFGQFSAIEDALEFDGQTLLFAMNAGMYHSDRSPVGHYLENGEEFMDVVPNAGPGNFGLVPNGIFCIRPNRADVIETQAFLAKRPDCQYATQSGPMLVIDGELHPRFLENGTSKYVRNGVGTTADGRYAVFVISKKAVNFHEFGSLFRDGLGMPSALYFDGNISRLHAPELNRSDIGFALGPIVGVVGNLPR